MKNNACKNQKQPAKLLNILSDKNTGKFSLAYLILFSLVFIFVAVICYTPFIIREQSLIWETDGLSQHYLALMYIGQWLREVLRTIFIEHSFSIPVWDFSIGSGADALTTFNYYGLGDPLCLLSVFVPAKYTVHLYNFLIILRIYLAGIFFSLFCFYKKHRCFETLLGAFTYMFCGYTLFAGVRHPFFLIPLMLFPLFILGSEKVLRNESPLLFILTVFIAFISNFYFSYMLVILTVIYVAVRFFTDKELKNIFKTAGRFILFGATGVLMSCVLLLPVLTVFLGSSRTEIERGSLQLLYDPLFYTSFFSKFMSYSNVGTWTITGFAPLSLISLVLLFKKRGEHLYLKIIFALLTLMLMIPLAGKFMNGLSYTSNRWIWGYGFFMSYIAVVMFPSLQKLSKKEKLTLIGFAGVYLLLSVVVSNSFNISMVAQYAIFSVLIMLFVCAKEFSDKKGRKLLAGSVAILTILSILTNSFFCYSCLYSDYIFEFIPTEKAYALTNKSAGRQMKEEMDKEFCRYEQIDNFVRNGAVVEDTNNVAFYWSLCDNHVGEFLKDNAAVRYTSYNFQHLYKFTSIDSIFAVKYYFSENKETDKPPYGYEYVKDIKTADGTFSVFENKHPLPLGFCYSDYMTRDEYMKLSYAQRQEAMLSNVLLEEDVQGFEKNTFTTESYEIPFTIESTDGAVVEDNKITALKKNATVTLEFEDVQSCELYLNFVNLQGENYLDKEEVSKATGKWNKLSVSEKLKIKRDVLYSRDVKEYTIYVSSQGYKTKFNLVTPAHQNYEENHNFLMNLGYNEESRNSITIKISDPAELTFDQLKVVVNPLEDYESKIADRSKNTLQNVQIGNNGFDGDISLAEPQLLFVSVPYNEGFKAYVDGKETEILRANTFGMALALSEGEHHIEFRYHTRGLALGAVLSLAGFAVFTAITLASRKKKK